MGRVYPDSGSLPLISDQVLHAVLDEEHAGARLDRVLVELFPTFSRTFLQRCIKRGQVLVDGAVMRPRDLVHGGEKIILDAGNVEVRQAGATGSLAAENIPLAVVHEDDVMLVVDKPVGMIVHPGAGHPRGTLVNALLYHHPPLKFLPRAGIVHRLDKDTSGVLAVAKTHAAHKFLTEQMQAREIRREYLCLVHGRVISGGSIDAPIGRHPRARQRMAVVPGGRKAVTHYRVVRRFLHHTLLEVHLETGRTHQIRVHMASIRHPVVGDPTYGSRRCNPSRADPKLSEALRQFRHQALHARSIGFKHPSTGKQRQWESRPPSDIFALLDLLSRYTPAEE